MAILQRMRSSAKGVVVKALIALLVVAMAAFGLDAFFYDRYEGNNTVLTIDGRDVTAREVENAVLSYRQQLSSQFGQDYIDSIPEETITEEAVNRLTREVLLSQQVGHYQLTASDDHVQQALAEIPEFRSETGFDREAFLSYLQANNISSQQLTENVRSSMAMQTLPLFVSRSSFTTEKEKDILASVAYESRDIQYAKIAYTDFADLVQPDEDAIKNYYEENIGRYQSEEMAAFEYLLLDKKQISEQLAEPDEEDINLAYQNHLAELSQDNRYGISHILVDISSRSEEEAKTRAEKVQSLLSSGSSFDELVKEYSDDPGSANKNGSLGLINPGDFLPEFGDQVKFMSIGEIVGPFLSDFGYHIIRLDETPESNKPALDEIRDNLIVQIKEQESTKIYEERKAALGNATFSAIDLSTPAQDLDMTLMETDFIPRSGATDTSQLFADKQLLDAAFHEEVFKDQLNSQVIDLGDKAVVVRLKEHRPQRQLELDEVLDQVRQAVILQQTQDQANTLAQNIIDEIDMHEDRKTADLLSDSAFLDKLSSLAPEGISLHWTIDKGLTRFAADVEPELINVAFRLKKTESLQIEETTGHIYLSVLISTQQPGYNDLTEEQQQDVDQELTQRNYEQSTRALHSFLQKRASISNLLTQEQS